MNEESLRLYASFLITGNHAGSFHSMSSALLGSALGSKIRYALKGCQDHAITLLPCRGVEDFSRPIISQHDYDVGMYAEDRPILTR